MFPGSQSKKEPISYHLAVTYYCDMVCVFLKTFYLYASCLSNSNLCDC